MERLERMQETARHVAAAIRSRPEGSLWFIHCDTDADGIASAAVMATALRRIGRRYQVRASRDKSERAFRELAHVEADGLLILDKGTNHSDVLADVARETHRPVVVVDHHNVPEEGVADGIHILNPRMEGLDGSHDACSSTTSVALALALDARNHDLTPLGLVGAIGDWQHMGGWKGWNKRLVDLGLEHGHLEYRAQPRFIGMDLADALTRFKPAIPELHGDVDACRSFLASIGLTPDGDNESLSDDEETRLLSALTVHGAAHGMSEADMGQFVHQDLRSVKMNMGLRRMFRVVDACGRENRLSTGLRYLLGDPDAGEDAGKLFETYQSTISTELERLRMEGTLPRPACQWFQVERPAYTGMVAGLGMTQVVPDRSRPMVVTADRDDGHIQVSTRGDDNLVERGMDLGHACHVAAHRVKAPGGGHPIAAGAVIEHKDLDRFLDALDEELHAQGFLEESE